jgi:hypothetical protein
MIKVSTKMNFSFPDFAEAQKELEKIAVKIIVPDIQGRMKTGVSISGTPHKPNTAKTRLYKALRGLSTAVPLIASGQLLNSFKVNLLGDKMVSIMPRGLRVPYPPIKTKFRLIGKAKGTKRGISSSSTMTNTDLADVLQNKGVHGTKYEFFGISDEAEGLSFKHMFEYIKKEIIRGGKKFVQ